MWFVFTLPGISRGTLCTSLEDKTHSNSMIKKEIKDIVKQLIKNKVSQLSSWKNVRYEGGRLYYESKTILNEISDYPIEIKIFYLESLLKENFILQDNWPSEAPDITKEFKNWLQTHISKLKIVNTNNKDDSPKRAINKISLDIIDIDNDLKQILILRIEEIEKCIKGKAYLSAIILIGSTLEGLLLGFALKYPQAFNSSHSVPKKDNKPKPFDLWTLSDFINAAHELGLIAIDIKEHSHSLRNFRNYIHTKKQLETLFFPDKETIKISWQVLSACVEQIRSNEDKIKPVHNK